MLSFPLSGVAVDMEPAHVTRRAVSRTLAGSRIRTGLSGSWTRLKTQFAEGARGPLTQMHDVNVLVARRHWIMSYVN